MEFRKCPGCQASVLDDDAEDCPFCGVSMSSKPAAAPAKAAPRKTPPAKPKASQAKEPAAPTRPQGKPKSIKQAIAEQPGPGEDGDPFDVDTSAVAKAPPVAPKPAKGRMIRVVCPMCETPGFISPKMRGRDVKCHNKECLVPIFKAPLPEKKEAPVEESSGLFSTTNLVIGSLVLVPILLFVGWFFLLKDRGPAEYVSKSNGVTADNRDADDTVELEVEAPPEPLAEEVKVSLTQLQGQALEQVVNAALARVDNRSKPFCRRMAAEAFADVGNIRQAQEQYSRLVALTSEKFYQVEPLAAIAWQQRAMGANAEASQTIEMVDEAATDFPSVGRAAPSSAIAAAAVLAADGRIDDGQSVFRRLDHDDDATLTRERVASLINIAHELEVFDLDRLLRYSSMDMAIDPLGVATAITLAAHGEWQSAIDWAMQANNVAAQEDCMSAIALVAARQAVVSGDDQALTLIRQTADRMSLTGQVRVEVGISTGSLMQGNEDSAAESLARALTLFEQIPRPDAVDQPETRSIVDGISFPAPFPLQSAAVGAAQMARLQVLLGETDKAWDTLLMSWDFTKGIGPDAELVFKLVTEIADNSDRAEERVGGDLGVGRGDVRTRMFRKYRRNIRDVDEAAHTRFDLEVALLREAIGWGLLDQVTEVLRDPASIISDAVDQPYQTTSLPSTLARHYEMAGNDSMAEEISALAPSGEEGQDRIAELIAETEAAFQSGDHRQAAMILGGFSSRFQNLEQRRDLRALQLTCRLLKLKNIDETVSFILALGEDQLMDDCFEMIAALSVKLGMGQEAWKSQQDSRLLPTQKAAYFRGLVAGIVAVTKNPTGDSAALQ